MKEPDFEAIARELWVSVASQARIESALRLAYLAGRTQAEGDLAIPDPVVGEPVVTIEEERDYDEQQQIMGGPDAW